MEQQPDSDAGKVSGGALVGRPGRWLSGDEEPAAASFGGDGFGDGQQSRFDEEGDGLFAGQEAFDVLIGLDGAREAAEEDFALCGKVLRAGQARVGIVEMAGRAEAEELPQPGLGEERELIHQILTIEQSSHLLLY